ncbi:phosphotransferase [Endozoicomonas ascidiicola]|uniref:phosphotransferase n=1 Tax=Endozoicomonas ascidiicola TaxID=1698521 RepID=UPI000835929E|nr:phosphotransferase [Endozoicomonas ascidiicola]
MRIQLLRQREDFEQGFIQSLSLFLSEYFNWTGEMRWDSDISGSAFLANDYLNVIYPEHLSRKRLFSLTREFAYNPRWYRRTLQQVYIYGAVRRPFESIATSARLIIENCPPELHNWVFIPGNHSHRAVDVVNERCFVFYKPGFNHSFIRIDAEIRQKHPWLPSPEVFEISESNTWYIEQRIRGLPLNRLGTPAKVDEALAFARNAIVRLYNETSSNCLLSDYVASVDQEFQKIFSSIEALLPSDLRIQFVDFLRKLRGILNEHTDHKIELVLSHGDFQPANLLVDHGKCWIIDWEYAATRSRSYDALCYGLMSRFSTGFAQRYDHLLQNPELLKKTIEWTGLETEISYPLFLPLFLLEECLVKLKEVAAESITDKEVILKPWFAEILLIRQFV